MTALETDFSRVSGASRAFLERAPAHFIDGQFVAAVKGGTIATVDPSSGKPISAIAAGTAEDIDAAVAAAKRALSSPAWAGLAPDGRERLIHRLADLIEENIDAIAELEILDNGMTANFARNLNVGSSINVLRYMAGWPSKITGRTIPVGLPIPGSKYFAATVREPVGVVGAIIPWNVPFMMAIWKAAPALAAGCTVVIKPAEDACLSVLKLGELVAKAGFPPGVVNIVTGYGAEAGDALVKHPDVAKISFTGSTVIGKRIGALASGALKKVTLELGGKSPTIVFADAELDRAAAGASDLIFLNSGQVCVAGSRLFVERRALDQVVEAVSKRANSLKMGPGMDPTSELGPLVSARQQQRVQSYIEGAKSAGATLVAGGQSVDSGGFYVRPTVAVDVKPDMQVVQEEIFGPVLSVMPFDDLEEVIAMANNTVYGLAATVWTRDLKKMHEIVPRLKCGYVAVNTDAVPHWALPQGGVKQSGVGKDLGAESVDSCLETKTLLVRYD